MDKPYELTRQNGAAVGAVRAVREAWGLEDKDDPVAWLPQYAYGVSFDYQTDVPGCVGPLCLLQGAGAPETRPMAFIRDDKGT